MSSINFPTYSRQRKIGDKGVSIVRQKVEQELEWIFRSVHLEDDFGIDGYIDILGNESSVTGKCLGVQIKTGESYFKSQSSIGWRFHGDNKHLNYYLNSSFPIILIIVSAADDKAYWVKFEFNAIDNTTNGWSIIIPRANVFNIESKSVFLNFVGDVIDYMPQLQYRWELNNLMKESSGIYLEVSKEEVNNEDINGFTNLLSQLIINDEMIANMRGKLLFFIDGYNNDPRELYEIPEVRKWTQAVFPAFKYWGYFLNMHESLKHRAGLRILYYCLVDTRLVGYDKENKLKITKSDPEQSKEFIERIYDWLNEFSDKYNISHEVNYEQSRSIAMIMYGIKEEDYPSFLLE